MITNNEITAAELSPIKKDFYQIWSELLDTASKISERWDPTSTNESDPGIVLLKVLTAVADKLNYNIDKNILEAFLPSAAQEESMRKLCEMLGYTMKYYQSATTTVRISYVGEDELTSVIEIPKFTSLTNTDNDVNYITIEPAYLSASQPKLTVNCIEGQIVQCETDNDNIILLNQLDENNRYYLPEVQIAENGLFIYNISDTNVIQWEKVDNLNTYSAGSTVYKFGYSSQKGYPYIQFPDDISNLIADGLQIYYTRTNGANGNISVNTLTTIELPSTDALADFTSDDFTISNLSASTNGTNLETMTQAYNNYKKTIGTFDTLVTCRDYMNKIYSLMSDENIALVSNVIVSDIRDDINKAITLCTFDNFGICYTEMPKPVAVGETAITNFDLILYPFKTITGLFTKNEFLSSFTYSPINKDSIIAGIEKSKTLSHTIKLPDDGSIVAIKNYLRLNAKITTTTKVNTVEEAEILSNIYYAIYENFNARNIDFGEAIPFDTILTVITNADSRIKNVSLDEPTLYTKFATTSGDEYDLASTVTEGSTTTYPGRELYNKLALRNIIAGRLSMFKYFTSFKSELSDTKYPDDGYVVEEGEITPKTYEVIYPTDTSTTKQIVKVKTDCTIPVSDINTAPGVTLAENEVIQFRAPRFSTTVTYPAYVNYYLHLNTTQADKDLAIPATMQTIETFMKMNVGTEESPVNRWPGLMTYWTTNNLTSSTSTFGSIDISTEAEFNNAVGTKRALYVKVSSASGTSYTYVSTFQGSRTYYYIPLSSSTVIWWNRFIQQQTYTIAGEDPGNYKGIYRVIDTSYTAEIGYMRDTSGNKYALMTYWVSTTDPFTAYYTQLTHTADQISYYKDDNKTIEYGYTIEGLGRDAVITGAIPANAEYKLKDGEYLYINYTESASASDATSTSSIVNLKLDAGTIIKPNFVLYGYTEAVAAGLVPTKTTGFDTSWLIDAMFTLGTNEQIEQREQVVINLGPSDDDSTQTTNSYVYWMLNNEVVENDVNKFPFDATTNTYLLQDGEYFFYTDENQTDVAYYGSGAEIVRTNNNLVLKKAANTTLTATDILTKGASAIPWVKQTLTSDATILVKDYQYINLVCNDAITYCNVIADTEGSTASTIIESTWHNLGYDATEQAAAVYKLAEDDGESYLPKIDVDGANWQIHTILNFNAGPELAQTLKSDYDSVSFIQSNNEVAVKLENLTFTEEETTYTLPVSFRSNYLIQSSAGVIDTTITTIDTETGDNIETNDFGIKVFKANDLELTATEATAATSKINTHNFGEYWTSVTTQELKDHSLTLNVNVINKSKYYGLLMLYYETNDDTVADHIRFKYTNTDTTSAATPVIFNYAETESWWPNKIDTDGNYILRPGINVVKITDSASLKFTVPAAASDTDNFIFSDLDLVNYTSTDLGIDLDLLQYQQINTTTTAAKQLLADLRTIDTDHNFYYNTPIDNAVAIDINTTKQLMEDNLEHYTENLSTSRIWYDYNNINNKFVISEIDVKDMIKGGISIARTSKKGSLN